MYVHRLRIALKTLFALGALVVPLLPYQENRGQPSNLITTCYVFCILFKTINIFVYSNLDLIKMSG